MIFSIFLFLNQAWAAIDTGQFDHSRICYSYAEAGIPEKVKRVMATPQLPADIRRYMDRLAGEFRGDHCSRRRFWMDLNLIADVQLGYKTDEQIHGKQDYWQTAEETFASRVGDCEDHAIAKYWMARYAGCAAEQIHIASWNMVPSAPKGHATLLVWLDGHYLNLDNNKADNGKRSTQLDHMALRRFLNEEEMFGCL